MIDLKDIFKYYTNKYHKTYVLQDINLRIEKGEFISVMGPSGAGKSTLLNILGMIDDPNDGEYFSSRLWARLGIRPAPIQWSHSEWVQRFLTRDRFNNQIQRFLNEFQQPIQLLRFPHLFVSLNIETKSPKIFVTKFIQLGYRQNLFFPILDNFQLLLDAFLVDGGMQRIMNKIELNNFLHLENIRIPNLHGVAFTIILEQGAGLTTNIIRTLAFQSTLQNVLPSLADRGIIQLGLVLERG